MRDVMIAFLLFIFYALGRVKLVSFLERRF